MAKYAALSRPRPGFESRHEHQLFSSHLSSAISIRRFIQALRIYKHCREGMDAIGSIDFLIIKVLALKGIIKVIFNQDLKKLSDQSYV